jgi:hypothetical protein
VHPACPLLVGGAAGQPPASPGRTRRRLFPCLG